ncbi:MAG TPA: ABC transporter ATP-binding protein [Thermoplasmata archaeon]
MPALEVENLRYYYRTRRGAVKAVDDVSFSIEPGETIAVVGESGCGKTSTANAIMRLLPRNVETYEGRVVLDGQDTMAYSNEEFRHKVRWRGISMVFQSAMNALSPTTRCGFQVAEPLMVHYDLEKEEALEAAREGLRNVGLSEDVAKRYPHELSGGMKQRVVIAMALVLKPKVVILDEPTSALDVMTQANIINLLKGLQKESRLAYLFITHDLGLASELADKVAIMYAGKIVEIGTASRVYPAPQHPYTQKLIQSVPLLRGEVAPDFIPGVPPDLTSVPAGCRFHPRCPVSFKMCGWSASELQAFLEARSGATGQAGVKPLSAAKFEPKDSWKLVVKPKAGTAPADLASEIRALVDVERAKAPVLQGIETVRERGERVVIDLYAAAVPELMGADGQRAACWLLTEEGKRYAGG